MGCCESTERFCRPNGDDLSACEVAIGLAGTGIIAWVVYRLCFSGSSRNKKEMKAPDRMGYIYREDFETDPDYFRSLHDFMIEPFGMLIKSSVCLIKNFGAALWDAFVVVFVSRRRRMAVLWWLLLVAKIAHLSVTWHLSYSFPHGNTKVISAMRSQSMGYPMGISHDMFPRIQPHVYLWTKMYGRNFINWHGPEAQLFVTEPDLIKEILNNKEDAYPKMKMQGYAKKLLGDAMITNEGEKWAKIRKLANHTFHANSLKGMIPEMSTSVEIMLERWRDYEGKEIDVHKEFGTLTTEVISRTAFGSSFADGKHIFDMVAKLTAITVRNIYRTRLPGLSQIIRTEDETEAEKLKEGIKNSILDLVGKRDQKVKNGEAEDYGSDYLGQLVKICHDSDANKRITVAQMVDEIRALYGAGHLTTTNLLSWTVFLLAVDTDWQDKARKEVVQHFGQENPSSDGIARLKSVRILQT
ncbi:hypothetical protein ACET3Z_030146 [Daucus carota]